ncbi:MAG: PorP/SprF family type IX secretion system membrane protein, partial [Saprospiraceae bacterium]|nr:PorP/SprF family type IX secretion system membrane protein [Saprospiraceae bacterium]
MKIRNTVLTCTLVLATWATMLAQEAGTFTHYHLNPVLLNPGATGFEEQHEFLFNYRNKWAAFDGAPRTFTMLYNGPAGERQGIGGQLLTKRIGKWRSFQATASYAYRFQADQFDFGIGLSTGFQQL